jgi:uncharacterized protein YjeT (DUF2065 family)
LRIQPSASISVSAFWIAFCWALVMEGFGTERHIPAGGKPMIVPTAAASQTAKK